MSGKDVNKIMSHGREIPIRRVVLSDPSMLPTDYGTTPGGTLFSTTPGGTRILYDRKDLLQLRNSPLTKSPPPNMAKIPGVTAPGKVDMPQEDGDHKTKPMDENTAPAPGKPEETAVFEMDM